MILFLCFKRLILVYGLEFFSSNLISDWDNLLIFKIKYNKWMSKSDSYLNLSFNEGENESNLFKR